MQFVKNVSSVILYPFEKVISTSKNILCTYEKNIQLRKDIAALKIEVQRCANMKKENALLREYYGFKRLANFQLIPCEIIGKNPGLYNKTLIVDRGFSKGITRNMTVVAASGLIGRVLETAKKTSEILTLHNRNSFVSAIDLRSRVQGIIGWKKGKSLIFDNVELHSDVKEGDTVLTSGMGDIFPKGIFIGKVKRVLENPNKIVMNIEIEPFVDFSLLENVFIIKEVENSIADTLSFQTNGQIINVNFDMLKLLDEHKSTSIHKQFVGERSSYFSLINYNFQVSVPFKNHKTIKQ